MGMKIGMIVQTVATDMTYVDLTDCVIKCVVGEDVRMGDLLVLGEDGKLYRHKKNDKRLKINRAWNDTKKNELVTIAIYERILHGKT